MRIPSRCHDYRHVYLLVRLLCIMVLLCTLLYFDLKDFFPSHLSSTENFKVIRLPGLAEKALKAITQLGRNISLDAKTEATYIETILARYYIGASGDRTEQQIGTSSSSTSRTAMNYGYHQILAETKSTDTFSRINAANILAMKKANYTAKERSNSADYTELQKIEKDDKYTLLKTNTADRAQGVLIPIYSNKTRATNIYIGTNDTATTDTSSRLQSNASMHTYESEKENIQNHTSVDQKSKSNVQVLASGNSILRVPADVITSSTTKKKASIRLKETSAKVPNVRSNKKNLLLAVTSTKAVKVDQTQTNINTTNSSRVKPLLSLMHIPKTGGTSLHKDIRHIANFAFGNPGWDEKCLRILQRSRGSDRIVTLFRDPLKHIYSQYLECKYDRWGKKVTRGTAFPRVKENEASGYMPGYKKWLEHFIIQDNTSNYPTNNTQADFRCYHPKDMQTRYLFCENKGKIKEWDHSWRQYAHHFNICNDKTHSAEEIKKTLKQFWFFGITEHYYASVCMLEYQIVGKFSEGCDYRERRTSTNQGTAHRSHITHHVPSHDIHLLDRETISMMKQLTSQDRLTYQLALTEFTRRAFLLSKQTGVELLNFGNISVTKVSSTI